MIDIVRFRAFRNYKLVYDVRVAKGAIPERMEREVLQDRLNQSDIMRVDVFESPDDFGVTKPTSVMMKVAKN